MIYKIMQVFDNHDDDEEFAVFDSRKEANAFLKSFVRTDAHERLCFVLGCDFVVRGERSDDG